MNSKILLKIKKKLFETTIDDDYKNFIDSQEEVLLNKFNIDNNFQTNVRGLKGKRCV